MSYITGMLLSAYMAWIQRTCKSGTQKHRIKLCVENVLWGEWKGEQTTREIQQV